MLYGSQVVGAVAQVAAVIIAVLLIPVLHAEVDMSWLDSMIDNIAQDARQTKAVQYDQLSWIRNRKAGKRDRALQFLREDTEIQRRVADARAAGVHPLFALGGSLGGGSSAVLPGIGSSAGQSSGGGGGGGSGIPDALELETHKAALEESAARTAMYRAQASDFVASSAARSSVIRAQQTANAMQDVAKISPDQQVSADTIFPSQTAGTHPAYREYVVSDYGLRMDLPYSEEGPSEALENIPFWLWPAIIAHNENKYGGDWSRRFYQEYVLGKAPIFRPASERERTGMDYVRQLPGQRGLK